jgi:hypothetical protein
MLEALSAMSDSQSFLFSILGSLNPEHLSGSTDPSLETRVEAANVIYSLSSGSSRPFS